MNSADVRDCHRLLLLQMAAEKLAKALLYEADPDASHGHAALNRLPGLLRRRDFARTLGFRSARDIGSFLDRVRPTLGEIAALSPSVGPSGGTLDPRGLEQAVNVEYPWQNPDGGWVCPAGADFSLLPRLRRRGEAFNALRFLERLLARAEQLGSGD